MGTEAGLTLFAAVTHLRLNDRLQDAWLLTARQLIDDPANEEALRCAGVLHRQQNALPRAEQVLRRAVRVTDAPAAALSELSQTLHMMDRDDEAEQVARRAVILAPDMAAAHHQLATALLEGKPPALVLPHYLRAVRCDEGHGRAWYGYASMLHRLGRGAEALEAVHNAIAALRPVAEVLALAAHICLDHGRLAEAVAYYSQAVQVDPEAEIIHSNLVMSMIYDPNRTSRQKAAAHRMWGALHADRLLPATPRHEVVPDPGKRLRVGFVSGDFTRHAISYFMFPLLRAIDRDRVEVYCYSNTAHPGPATETFKHLSDGWRDILHMGDEEAAALIRRDCIDILIDLSGHTSGHRLLIFARKPAPVQVTWLGYAATTGMRAMDYRITDAVADPPGLTEDLHTETLLRLPRTFLCYEPAGDLPEPVPRAAAAGVTFASFNNMTKVTEDVVKVWARIVAAVPGATILLKNRSFIEPTTRDRYARWFEAGGLPQNRICFVGHVPSFADHVAFYRDVDIGLDPFPYNGTTTTCEALWMGVPVVTLAGDSHVCRVGATLLPQVGLGDLVAEDVDGYVQRAVALATDRPRLAALRRDLRGRMASSSLCDAKAYAEDFEAALRGVWTQWCATAGK